MKQRLFGKGSTDGGAMLIVLTLTLVLSALLLLVEKTAMQRAYMTKRLTAHVRAEAIAETGITDAYAKLAEDFDLAEDPSAFPETTYDGGTYDVTVLKIDDENASITSEAEYDGIYETVVVDVRKEQLVSTEADVAYGYAILADGTITWTGCGVFDGQGRVHGNGKFTQSGSGEVNALVTSSTGVRLNGNSGEIDGDVTAPSISGKTSKITGTITEQAVATVAVPQIDLAPYYNEAVANGQAYNGSQTLSSSHSPSGGVMWVNGDLHISGSGVLTGCFIATGDIHLSGSASQTKVEQYPGFMSRDGDIKISGSGTWEGLVYARIGDVEITGGGRVEGSIIAGGNFKKAGSSTVFAYVESVPVAPNEEILDGVLCVSAWHQ